MPFHLQFYWKHYFVFRQVFNIHHIRKMLVKEFNPFIKNFVNIWLYWFSKQYCSLSIKIIGKAAFLKSCIIVFKIFFQVADTHSKSCDASVFSILVSSYFYFFLIQLHFAKIVVASVQRQQTVNSLMFQYSTVILCNTLI